MRLGPLALAAAALLAAGCGTTHHAAATTRTATRPLTAKQAELARERRNASYARPSPAALTAAGPTAAARNAAARAQLRRAARDLQAYHRRHGTYAVGPVAALHRLDPATGLVDFVDGRDTDFFLAVDPPSTTTIWRYNFDHSKARTSCGPGGSGCPPGRHW